MFTYVFIKPFITISASHFCISKTVFIFVTTCILLIEAVYIPVAAVNILSANNIINRATVVVKLPATHTLKASALALNTVRPVMIASTFMLNAFTPAMNASTPVLKTSVSVLNTYRRVQKATTTVMNTYR